MKTLLGKWIGKKVHVTLRSAMPVTLEAILVDADDFGIMLELPKGDTYVPATSILHVSLLDKS